MSVGTFMTWGLVSFSVYPLNAHEYSHRTQSAYGRKEIIQSTVRREWTGEGDEEISLRGRVFPYHRIGGLSELDFMEANRKARVCNQLVRGNGTDGQPLGWFLIETLNRGHTNIGPSGVGRIINFDVRFVRAGKPNAAEYLSSIMGLVGA